MRIEFQLQIDAIKGLRIYFKEYSDLTLITDGYIGVYLTKSELKIDKSKMIEMKHNPENTLDPHILFKERTKAIETRIARKLSHQSEFAIQLKSTENDETCFVKEKYLKMFPGFTNLFIKTNRSPVLVYKYGNPYGFILPVNISADE